MRIFRLTAKPNPSTRNDIVHNTHSQPSYQPLQLILLSYSFIPFYTNLALFYPYTPSSMLLPNVVLNHPLRVHALLSLSKTSGLAVVLLVSHPKGIMHLLYIPCTVIVVGEVILLLYNILPNPSLRIACKAKAC